MKVHELIAKLQQLPQDAEVMTRKTERLGSVGEVNNIQEGTYGFIRSSIKTVVLTDEYPSAVGLFKERCMKLLNECIDYVGVGRNLSEQIDELIEIGFTPDELAANFGFGREDIDKYLAGEDIDEDDDEDE